MVHYVLLMVADKSFTKMVGLIKDRGPDFLIGKRTFPGGKIDSGENPFDAARREMREETGLKISDWTIIDTERTPEGDTLFLMMATSNKIEEAKTQESEEILIYDIEDEIHQAKMNPTKYSRDFITRINSVMEFFTEPALQ